MSRRHWVLCQRVAVYVGALFVLVLFARCGSLPLCVEDKDCQPLRCVQGQCAASEGVVESSSEVDASPPQEPLEAPRDAGTLSDGETLAERDASGEDAAEMAPELPEVAVPEKTVVRPFHEGPYGFMPRQIAGDFRVPTTEGDWDFRTHWTGEDSYVFLFMAGGYSYTKALWNSPVLKLLQTSPKNVHYFFLTFRSRDGSNQSAQFIASMKSNIEQALSSLLPSERAHWKPRLHLVTARVMLPNEKPGFLEPVVGGWLGEWFRKRLTFLFAIDPFQRVREVGYLSVPPSQTPLLTALAQEPRLYNFEVAREKALWKKDVTTIEVAKEEVTRSAVDKLITFPDAQTMAKFDSMEVDLKLYCKDHLDSTCGEWDYLAYLYLCEPPSQDEPDKMKTPCKKEVARWITPYHREGRWIMDVSSMLAWFKEGGEKRLRFSANPQPDNAMYHVSLSIRLFNRAKGIKPVTITPMFTGGKFDQDYNKKYEAKTFTVPSGVKKVELVAVITGHGFGKDTANCAEFCNHTHHFTLNGKEYSKTHPIAGTTQGCLQQVSDGVIPNQFGTWVYGRAGWCPGLEVKPFVVDVTAEIKQGQENTLTYRGLFQGKDYTPVPSNGSNGGFNANIRMNSYIVYWR